MAAAPLGAGGFLAAFDTQRSFATHVSKHEKTLAATKDIKKFGKFWQFLVNTGFGASVCSRHAGQSGRWRRGRVAMISLPVAPAVVLILPRFSPGLPAIGRGGEGGRRLQIGFELLHVDEELLQRRRIVIGAPDEIDIMLGVAFLDFDESHIQKCTAAE